MSTQAITQSAVILFIFAAMLTFELVVKRFQISKNECSPQSFIDQHRTLLCSVGAIINHSELLYGNICDTISSRVHCDAIAIIYGED